VAELVTGTDNAVALYGAGGYDSKTGVVKFTSGAVGTVEIVAAHIDLVDGPYNQYADGTKCSSPNSLLNEYRICPKGLAPIDTVKTDPSLVDCNATPSSPECTPSLCEVFPDLAYCQLQNSSNSNSTPSSSSRPPPSSDCSVNPSDPMCTGPTSDFCDLHPNYTECLHGGPPSSGSGTDGGTDGTGGGSSGSGGGSSSGSGGTDGGTDGGTSPGGTSSNSGGSHGGGSPNGGTDGGTDPNGADCAKLGNCDWAKQSTQVEIKGILQTIRDLAGSIYESVANGVSRIVEAIGSISGSGNGDGNGSGNGSGSGNSSGSGGNGDGNGGDYPSICANPANHHLLECGGSGSGNGSGKSSGSGDGDCDGYDVECYPGLTKSDYDCDGAVGFFRRVFTSDCGNGYDYDSDGDYGFGGTGVDTSGASSKANSLIAGGGRIDIYTQSEIGSMVPLSRSGTCPVIQGSFKFVKRSYPYRWDFNNLAPGSSFNVAAFVKTCLLIFVYFINVFSMIKIFQSGGRS
jgi:hypothetical protein